MENNQMEKFTFSNTIEPKVGIVIVNWNKKDCVLNLLQQIKEMDYKNYEIVVVDNASTDGSPEIIKEKYPDATIIKNNYNLGGSGGFNKGLEYYLHKKDEYRYIWCVDNDIEIEKKTLKELVKVMEKNETIGIVGSSIMEYLSSKKKNSYTEIGAYINWKNGDFYPNPDYFSNELHTYGYTINIDYVALCSALIRKEVIEKIGILDERYFLKWDDIDLCMRVKKNGFKVAATSKSKIWHPTSINYKKNFIPMYYEMRNAYLFMSKYLDFTKGLSPFYIINKKIIRNILLGYISGLHSAAYAYLKAFVDFMNSEFNRGSINIEIVNKLDKKTDLAYRKFPVLKSTIKTLNRVIIIGSGNYHQIEDAFKILRNENQNIRVDLIIPERHLSLFKDVNFNKIYSSKGNIWYKIKNFFVLKGQNYDATLELTIPNYFSSLQFIAKRRWLLTFDNELVSLKKEILMVLVPFIPPITRLLSILMLPFVYLKAKKINKSIK